MRKFLFHHIILTKLNYSPIFFLYAALKISSAVLMLFMNLEFKTPATSVVADVMSVLKKLELIALFIACFVLGKSDYLARVFILLFFFKEHHGVSSKASCFGCCRTWVVLNR